MRFWQVFSTVVLVIACFGFYVDVRRAFAQYTFVEATKRIVTALIAMVALTVFISLCIVWGTSLWRR